MQTSAETALVVAAPPALPVLIQADSESGCCSSGCTPKARAPSGVSRRYPSLPGPSASHCAS